MNNTTVGDKLAEAVLAELRQGPSSIADISKQNQIDHNQTNNALDLLTEWGYELNRESDSVELVSTPDKPTDIEIAHGLNTKFIGHTIHAYQSVKSTNDIAGQLGQSNAVEGTIVVADQQTVGRGRLGRSWHSPPNRGIYLSILLRPTLPPDKVSGISVMTALALAEVLTEYCPRITQIKWPNDLLLYGKKTAGILTELSAELGKVNYLVVGVGMNINQTLSDFPDDLFGKATSVREAHGAQIKRVEFLQKFLLSFEREYLAYQRNQLEDSRDRLRSFSSLLNRHITLRSGNDTIEGIATDLGADGTLILEHEGRRISVSSGEVTIVSSRE